MGSGLLRRLNVCSGGRVTREGEGRKLDLAPVELCALCVERVEVVVLARLSLQGVDDDGVVVEDDPPGHVSALRLTVKLAELLETDMELLVNSFHVRAAEPCDDHEVVRHLEIFAHLIDPNILRLLLIGELGAGCSELLGVDDGLRLCE